MKNTAKKILALVFAVAMICTLAVPAFAADEEIEVSVTLVKPVKGTVIGHNTVDCTVDEDFELGDTLHDLLGEFEALGYTYSASKGVYNVLTETEEEAMKDADGAWVVAVNGKVITAYKDYVMADGDEVVIYWADDVFGTKLVMVDYSQILKGIVSFYYYDAEGNKLPVVGMEMNVAANGLVIGNKYADETSPVGTKIPAAVETGANGFGSLFVTDEAGQIWIAPEDLVFLDNGAGKISYENVAIAAAKYNVKKTDTANHDEDVAVYYATFGSLNYVTGPATAETDGLFDGDAYDAPNTGDMTFVYVLVAAVAVVTLGAVVIMKKKASKAN